MSGINLELGPPQKTPTELLDLSIGQHLRLITDKLLSAGHFFTNILDFSEALYVDNLLSTLDNQACRIAVIGQVNAGKSSFINALVQRPGLLPTGMDPCTAVLTRLNFGNKRQMSGSAQFSFFSAQEWEKLISATGDNQTEREVASHALLNLEKQLSGERIEQKPAKKTLLLQSVTKQTLSSYIADKVETSDTSVKQLSEITKTADLFIDLYPFRYPTVVIDTPGVNHSTQKRGPITWENINEADIYLVMIKATEGLSDAEISLLKNLHTLREDRIIILINHIDAAISSTSEWQKVIKDVERQIRTEVAEAQFPIVLTSAYWAECALSGDPSRMAAAFTPQVEALASETLLARQNALDSRFPNDLNLAASLFNCSGIPATAYEIDKLMSRADCFNHAHDTVINLLRLSHINLALRKIERDGYQSLIASYKSGNSSLHNIGNLSAELDALDSKRSQMSDVIRYAESTMIGNATRGLEIIEKNLLDTLRFYTLSELRKISTQNSPDEVALFFAQSANAIALKKYVSSTIVKAYREIKREIFIASLNAYRDLDEFIGNTLSLTDRAAMLPWFEKRMPSFIPVSQSIEIDMNNFFSRVNQLSATEGAQASAVQSAQEEFSSLLEHLLHDMKTDIFNTINKEVINIKVIMNFITNRLSFVLDYKKGIIEKYLSEIETERLDVILTGLNRELNNVNQASRDSCVATEMLMEVYLLIINKRNATASGNREHQRGQQ